VRLLELYQYVSLRAQQSGVRMVSCHPRALINTDGAEVLWRRYCLCVCQGLGA
jgi:hypothetical protein